jgi:hypothetical protein
MSYVSLLKNVPGALSQPTGIAAIASLGIHGAIALIVPLMPVNSSQSSKADAPKAVGLMELSAADQSRLPQPPQKSEVALEQPKLPLQQQLSSDGISTPLTNYPPLTTQLSNQSVLPIIPSSPRNYNLSSLPTRQSIERMVEKNLRTQNYRFSTKNEYARYTPSASPFVSNLDKKIRETESLRINRLPELRANNEIPGEPLNNPSAELIDIGTRTSAGISPPQTVESENNAVKIAQSGEKLALAGISKGQTPEIFPSQSESKAERTEQLLAKLKSYNNLRQNTRQEYPNAKEKGVIRETISTETSEMEGTVMGRLVIDPDGKVLEIKFQKGTGSPQLESKARSYFSKNPPQADKQLISSYPFQLKFQNNRNTASVEKSRNAQNTKNPSVTLPLNTPTPTATATATPTPTQNGDSMAISPDPNQKLIQTLRQIKEERQKSE